jgi:hypothetical protein
VAGLTDVFPLATHRSTGRGGTVALDPSGRASLNGPAAAGRRRAGRILVGSVLGLAALVAGAAVAVWAMAGRVPLSTAVEVASPVRIPTATSPATKGQRPALPGRDSEHDERGVPLVTVPTLGEQKTLATAGAPSRGAPLRGKHRPAASTVRSRAGGRGLGGSRKNGENPYVKLEDLKPDPF